MNYNIKRLFDVIEYRKKSYRELFVVKRYGRNMYQFYVFSMNRSKCLAVWNLYDNNYIYEYDIDNNKVVAENNRIKQWCRKEKIAADKFVRFIEYGFLLGIIKYLNSEIL